MILPLPNDMFRYAVDSAGQAEAVVRIGGKDHKLGYSRSCKTCNSPWRGIIEMQLRQGVRLIDIARGLPEGSNLSADNIGEHRKRGHSSKLTAVIRDVLEEEAGVDADMKDMVTNYIAFARVGMAMAMEAMISGDSPVTIKDGIAFAKILQRAEAEAAADGRSSDMEDVYADLFTVYYESVSAVCTEDQMSKINAKIESHPLMLKLRIAAQQRSEDWRSEALEEAS